MIVKNEEHCIVRCLESLKNHIDYWVICDTGSTDNTIDLIHKTLNGIPGELHRHDWHDFSTNRNLSLAISKTKADYTLIIDADDKFIFEHNFSFKKLCEEVYKIRIEHNSVTYYRPQLIHNSIEFNYIGLVHEYINLPEYVVPITLQGCKILYGADGHRSSNSFKYINDALVFESELIKKPNDHRNTFYCAQSYRDAGKYEEALAYYLKRDLLGGWIEERFIAILESAKILEIVSPENITLIESAYIRAFNCNSKRIESLLYLAAYCRKMKLYDKAYFYAKIGCTVKKPSDGLFIEEPCYDWKIYDEMAIASFHLGEIEEAIELNKYLLRIYKAPENELRRIFNNLQLCKSKY